MCYNATDDALSPKPMSVYSCRMVSLLAYRQN